MWGVRPCEPLWGLPSGSPHRLSCSRTTTPIPSYWFIPATWRCHSKHIAPNHISSSFLKPDSAAGKTFLVVSPNCSLNDLFHVCGSWWNGGMLTMFASNVSNFKFLKFPSLSTSRLVQFWCRMFERRMARHHNMYRLSFFFKKKKKKKRRKKGLPTHHVIAS